MESRLELAAGVAAGQDGLITAGQCEALGFSPGELRRLVGSRRWRGVFRGVYFTRPEIMSDRQRVRAALLSLGPAAVAVLTSAGIVHGWPVLPRDPTVQISLPGARRRLDQPGLTARQLVLDPEDVTTIDGLAVTTPARTAADLLLRLPSPEAVAMLDAVLHARLISADDLDAASALLYRHRGAIRARESIAAADGRAQSPLETRVRLICQEGGVPPEALQFPVYDENGILIAITDFAWPSCNVLAEADGRAIHSTPDALLHDRRRQNDLTARGFIVIRFTWSDTHRPAYIIQTVRRALAAGAARSR
jgi:hypothetical protein